MSNSSLAVFANALASLSSSERGKPNLTSLTREHGFHVRIMGAVSLRLYLNVVVLPDRGGAE